jgi:hypothetical protein
MGFTEYSWLDTSAPQLDGNTGSLLTLLDAVLVNGYGTKPGAGWTKPLPNTSSYGMYRLGNGTTSSLFIYDAGAGGAGGCEAMATGWITITAIDNGAVTGSNPFPSGSQLNITSSAGGQAGAVVIRKSLITSSIQRAWKAFADSASLYLFTKPFDSVSGASWSGFHFGDFYSLKSGSIDPYRCMIVGRSVKSSSAIIDDSLDRMTPGQTALNSATQGHYVAKLFNGDSGSFTGSIAVSVCGDGIKSSNTAGLTGAIPFLNGCDNAIYVSPMWIVETGPSVVRGRMRGFWHFCHNSSSLTDGQAITGAMDFPTKTFRVVLPTYASSTAGTYLIEISDTLETNAQ